MEVPRTVEDPTRQQYEYELYSKMSAPAEAKAARIRKMLAEALVSVLSDPSPRLTGNRREQLMGMHADLGAMMAAVRMAQGLGDAIEAVQAAEDEGLVVAVQKKEQETTKKG